MLERTGPGAQPILLIRIISEPLLHFLLIGGLLYGLQQWWGQQTLGDISDAKTSPPAELLRPLQGDKPIVVTQAIIDRLRQQSGGRFQRRLNEAQIQGLIEREIDEEVLYREALRRRLDHSDRVVRRRLIQNMRFAYGDAGTRGQTDEELLRAARDLGMVDSDVVVRRRLIQRMKMGIESAIALSEAQVREYADERSEAWALPARYSFRHRFFSTDQRGAAAQSDALSALNDPQMPGDPMVWGGRFNQLSHADVARRFGESFASGVAAAPLDTWIGPLQSTYGFHLVNVSEKKAGRKPTWAEIKDRAKQELWAKYESRHLREQLNLMRQQYEIVVERPQAMSQ